MRPYKLKHIPTGLYFQPHKHGGSHLSKAGKIYQNNTHGLSSAIKHSIYLKNPDYSFTVLCQYDSHVYKLTKNILNWSDPKKANYGVPFGQIRAETKLTDWIKEEI